MSVPYIPRPYQLPTTNYILDTPRCAVWGFLGSGKTGAVLDAVSKLQVVEPNPVLVVAPLRVARSTWRNEIAKWDEFSHLKISCAVGNPAERTQALSRKADIYTVNFENLDWLVEKYKNDWPFRTVIWDEATKLGGIRCSEQRSKSGKVFIRAGGSARLRGLARIAHTKIDRFVELTGTPSPNGYLKLWGQIWFIDKGLRLGRSYDAFVKRWFRVGYDGYSLEPLPNAHREIDALIADVCMSLDPKAYFNRTEPDIIPVYVDLPQKAASLYKDMQNKMYLEIKNKGIEAFNAGSRTMKCRQIASGAIYHEGEDRKWSHIHDEKIAALHSIIEEANGMPLIIVYDFKSDLERLKKAFPDGRQLNTQKDEDDFKAGRISKLFMHFKSAGHGIDGFQYVTNMMVILSPDWNLEDFDQGVGRIGPIRQAQAGMNRGTRVYPIVARGTVDEDIMERWKTKRSVQDILLNRMKFKH